MATHLGKPVLLLDITRGPQALATGMAEAAAELGCDAMVLLDVGGDVLAHGDEPGLASPLCDAIVLAAGLFLARSTEVIGAVYGPGCDGELTPDEVLERITALQTAGALLGAWGLTPQACELVESGRRGRADRGEPDGRPLRSRRARARSRSAAAGEAWSSRRSALSPSSSTRPPRPPRRFRWPPRSPPPAASSRRTRPWRDGRAHGAQPGARARPSPRVASTSTSATNTADGSIVRHMTWIETDSLSFTARHDDADLACAHRVLDALEDLRLRLEDRFD